ncbi:MAG: hypothetical protein ACM3VS_13365 [Candidatus Dadabacteria bacterium]
MEKILLVVNSHKPDMGTIEFGCRIAALAETKLTGVFIDNPYTAFLPSAPAGDSYFKAVREASGEVVTTDTDQAIRLFVDECRRKGIPSEIYTDKGDPIQEVIFESRFADMLIIDPDISFYDREEQLPSHFVKQILANAECPVLLGPEKFEEIEEIIFCYDGSASAVFAIKQFTYLLPEFSNMKVMLLEVNNSGSDEFNESDRRMMEWLRTHYHSAYYHALKGEAKNELFNFLFLKRKKILVLGAYGRSMLSNFFKKSAAEVLIRTVDLPLFIAHH